MNDLCISGGYIYRMQIKGKGRGPTETRYVTPGKLPPAEHDGVFSLLFFFYSQQYCGARHGSDSHVVNGCRVGGWWGFERNSDVFGVNEVAKVLSLN